MPNPHLTTPLPRSFRLDWTGKALLFAAFLFTTSPVGAQPMRYLAPTDAAAAERFMVNSGKVFFYANPAVGTKEVPNWTVLFEIPTTLDTSSEVHEVFCALNAEKVVGDDEREGVKKVTARWTSRLYVLDLSDSQVSITKIASGRIKTNAEGRGELTFDIPTELFADGFESGDVSAWASVSFEVKKIKSAMDSNAECFAVDDL